MKPVACGSTFFHASAKSSTSSSLTCVTVSCFLLLLKLSNTTAMRRFSVINDPKTTKVMKYRGAPSLPQHSPISQSTFESQSLVFMQSYMIAFHASPVTVRSNSISDIPKSLKFACSLRCSPNFTFPNMFIPNTPYTNINRNSNPPMFMRLGKLITSVLNNILSPFSVRINRNTRARRNSRNIDAIPPPPMMYPMIVVHTQKKSKQFHRSLKYALGYIAYSFAIASRRKMQKKKYPNPSSTRVVESA
mmetsp:Transcript_3345/g.11246  ORF Transcript_3345/g.11246 Transcript_3345/m.11246 type:complete len:247 (-) Transcript_3345:938-1678(-)